jgi:hypothetical protein
MSDMVGWLVNILLLGRIHIALVMNACIYDAWEHKDTWRHVALQL